MKKILIIFASLASCIAWCQNRYPAELRQGAKFPNATKINGDSIAIMDGNQVINGYRRVSELPKTTVDDGFTSTATDNAGSSNNNRRLYHKGIETSNAIKALSRSFLNRIATTINNDYSDLHNTVYSGSGNLGVHYLFIERDDNTFRFVTIVDSTSTETFDDFDATNTVIRGASSTSLTSDVPNDNVITNEYFEILVTTLETTLEVSDRFYYKIYNVYQPSGINFYNNTTPASQYYFSYYRRDQDKPLNLSEVRTSFTLQKADIDSIVNIGGSSGTIYEPNMSTYLSTFDIGDVITIRQADSAQVKLQYNDNEGNGNNKYIQTYERGDKITLYKSNTNSWDVLSKPPYKPNLYEGVTAATGSLYVIYLDNPAGNYYNMGGTAITGTFQTALNPVMGGWTKLRINLASSPQITAAQYTVRQLQGATFQTNTDMYLVVEFNGINIDWYLLEI